MGCGNQQQKQETTITEDKNLVASQKSVIEAPKETIKPVGTTEKKAFPPVSQTGQHKPVVKPIIQLNVEEKINNNRQQKRITEHLMLENIDLKMHGSSELNPAAEGFISDAQVQVQSSTEVLVTVKGNSSIRVIAVTADQFPIESMGNMIADSGEQMNTATIAVSNNGQIKGFILLIASSGQPVEVHIDGQGKPMLCLSYIDPLP